MKKPLQNFWPFLAFLTLGMHEIPKNLNIIIVGGTLSQYSHRNNLWTILANNSHCEIWVLPSLLVFSCLIRLKHSVLLPPPAACRQKLSFTRASQTLSSKHKDILLHLWNAINPYLVTFPPHLMEICSYLTQLHKEISEKPTWMVTIPDPNIYKYVCQRYF